MLRAGATRPRCRREEEAGTIGAVVRLARAEVALGGGHDGAGWNAMR